ncbi:PREDICTED: cancer/testis antigen 55-like [Dipodomys ordii]|uniref:Cancer/testis antigen 55-like n=1 Tax=Dipodomys ordii TaxID=10020 RepID=A0A1S3FC15_DIPOR|nr:PREDICTED: cancer/testis antigen 55-like [Dipodomys ordii]
MTVMTSAGDSLELHRKPTEDATRTFSKRQPPLGHSLDGRIRGKTVRRADTNEEQQETVQGESKLKTVEGFVTSFGSDHGWIDESIYFSADATGNASLKVGQKVTAVVEEDELSSRLKAIKANTLYPSTTQRKSDFLQVDAISENFEVVIQPDPKMRVLAGCVTRVKKNIVYIDKKLYFSLDIFSTGMIYFSSHSFFSMALSGFVPYKGDWVEIEYSKKSRNSKIKAHSVKPMNCKHVENIYITSIEERNGVIDYSIFFTLDSLKCPAGYEPQEYDLVNAVIVESTQVGCTWRAVSITPVQSSL